MNGPYRRPNPLSQSPQSTPRKGLTTQTLNLGETQQIETNQGPTLLAHETTTIGTVDNRQIIEQIVLTLLMFFVNFAIFQVTKLGTVESWHDSCNTTISLWLLLQQIQP